jgi:hypothetical protein
MKEAMEEEQREQLAEAGAPGQTEGPTNPVVYPSDEQAQVDLNHSKALVNSANADALFKLAQAVKWLYDANFQKEADLVAKQLVSLLPNKAKDPVAKRGVPTPDPISWAEGLIRQLPVDHDGRNSWLLNYGSSPAEEPSAGKPAEAEEALPPELAELISKMRAAGFEVDAVRIPL